MDIQRLSGLRNLNKESADSAAVNVERKKRELINIQLEQALLKNANLLETSVPVRVVDGNVVEWAQKSFNPEETLAKKYTNVKINVLDAAGRRVEVPSEEWRQKAIASLKREIRSNGVVVRSDTKKYFDEMMSDVTRGVVIKGHKYPYPQSFDLSSFFKLIKDNMGVIVRRYNDGYRIMMSLDGKTWRTLTPDIVNSFSDMVMGNDETIPHNSFTETASIKDMNITPTYAIVEYDLKRNARESGFFNMFLVEDHGLSKAVIAELAKYQIYEGLESYPKMQPHCLQNACRLLKFNVYIPEECLIDGNISIRNLAIVSKANSVITDDYISYYEFNVEYKDGNGKKRCSSVTYQDAEFTMKTVIALCSYRNHYMPRFIKIDGTFTNTIDYLESISNKFRPMTDLELHQIAGREIASNFIIPPNIASQDVDVDRSYKTQLRELDALNGTNTILVYYDIETYVNRGGEHTLNLLCYSIDVVGDDGDSVIYTKYSIREMLNHIAKVARLYGREVEPETKAQIAWCKKMGKEKALIPAKVVMIAHNGCKYDHQFVYKYLSNVCVMGTSTSPKGYAGRYNECKVELKDSVKYLQCKLEDMPRTVAMKVDMHKGVLPYSVYSEETVALRYIPYHMALENIKPTQLAVFIEESRPFVDGVITDINNVPEDIMFRHQEYCAYYCKKDVEILRACYNKFREMSFSEFNIDPIDYYTMPAFSDAYMKTCGVYDGVKEYANEARCFLTQTVEGGKCFTYREKKVSVEGKIVSLDANSLYPSAMIMLRHGADIASIALKKLGIDHDIEAMRKRMTGIPLGEGTKISTKTIEFCLTHWCEFSVRIFNLPIDTDIPVLTKKVDGKRRDVRRVNGEIYYINTITLVLLILVHGCSISDFEVVDGMCWCASSDKMSQVVERIYSKRLEYQRKGEPLEGVLKLQMNSSYGKAGEKFHSNKVEIVDIYAKRQGSNMDYNGPHGIERAHLHEEMSSLDINGQRVDCTKQERYEDDVRTYEDSGFSSEVYKVLSKVGHRLKGFTVIDDAKIAIDVANTKTHYNRIHVSSLILSASKFIFFMSALAMWRAGGKCHYGDTDSIKVDVKYMKSFKDIYSQLLDELGIDFMPKEVIGANPMQWKFDLNVKPNRVDKGTEIYADKFIAVGKKAYMERIKYISDGVQKTHYTYKLKGIPKVTLERYMKEHNLLPDQLFERLYDGDELTFDLLDGRVSFDIAKDGTITNTPSFIRKVCFT